MQAKGGYHSNDSVWRYGLRTPNLGGTARTLDDVDGAIPLENGVLAYNGVAMVDDSHTVLLEDDGWIAPRRPGTLDLYVFSYGRDYKARPARALRPHRPDPGAAALRPRQLVEPLPPLHRRRVRRPGGPLPRRGRAAVRRA